MLQALELIEKLSIERLICAATWRRSRRSGDPIERTVGIDVGFHLGG
jgi:hypothetical protein